MTARHSIWKNPPRGFRMMWWDPIAFFVCAIGVWLGWEVIGEWTLIAPYVLGTFFLFCNVFRVRRNAELIWAGVFLCNSALWLALAPSLAAILLSQSVVTVVVLVHAVRSEGYRGVWADRLDAV